MAGKPLPVQSKTREIGYAHDDSSPFWSSRETAPELQWPLSIRVFDEMRRQDAQCASVLRAVTMPIRRTQWRIAPNGARPEVVQAISQDLGLPIVGVKESTRRRARGRFSWGDHLRQALLMLPFGHMYFEQVYRVEDGMYHLHKLAPRMPQSISGINVARDGGLVSIEQFGTDKPIPVGQLVAYVNEREGGDWLGTSLLRPAYKNWMIKDILLRVQAQTIDRNGMGVPVYEAGEHDEQAQLDAGEKIAQSYRSGDASGASLPWKARLRLLGVEGNLPDAQPAIDYHDSQIGRSVLAHFLNLGSQTGSWALGSTFADFFVMSLQTSAEAVRDIANQHIVEDLVDANWGEDEPAPLIVCDEIGSRKEPTAEAIKILVDAGILTPDATLEQAVRDDYGLPPLGTPTEGGTA